MFGMNLLPNSWQGFEAAHHICAAGSSLDPKSLDFIFERVVF
jgi:hypothetical protein